MKILEIVDEIEKERERQGLTVEELCKHAGVSMETYSRWNARKSYATLAPLSCIMDVLNLEIKVVKWGAK
jgi:transcriptional regulator with XRE-family HTH domain